MPQTRIYLVGFMGAGKSTIGRLLAKKLGWKFIDLDREIEREEGRSISDIFALDGEAQFRRLEFQYLQRLSNRHQIVVALGGGAFTQPETRELANSTGVTAWLKVSFATVASRVKMDGTRPKFANKGQAEILYLSREPLYRLAKIHVETENQSPVMVAEEISKVIRTV